MKPKRITILGSTGSIGRSTIDVINQHPGRFEIVALAAGSNVELIEKQFLAFRPRYIAMASAEAAKELSGRLKGQKVEILAGSDEIIKLASLPDVDLVVNAIVGAAGLKASLETLKAGKILALANKESMVTGGPLFSQYQNKNQTRILPIDSEHSAIWQALACGRLHEVRNIILTASGGPFRTLPPDQFSGITIEQALDHPTWKMGSKITIDSATLANKGLEVIEAVMLFGIPADQIKVVVHPQSIIHSMVEFVDSSIIAQLSNPDMRLPITYALFWPDRAESDFGRLDPTKLSDLTFEAPDFERFPLLKIAFEVARTGGTAPALYNAANEIAVEAFLAGSIKFTEFSGIIENVLEKIIVVSTPDLEDIIRADQEARETAKEKIEELACC